MATESGPVPRETLTASPGEESPAPEPDSGEHILRTLSAAECFALLEPGGVGRVGFESTAGIEMLPVNFSLVGKTIVFRTAPDTLLAAYGDAWLSFETDRLDEARREGWSVLVQGHARKVTGEREVRRLEHEACEPWAGGARDIFVRITPTRISGRRIH